MKRSPLATLGFLALTLLPAWLILAAPGEAKAAGWFNCQIEAVYELGPHHTGGAANTIQVGCFNQVVSGVNYVGLQMNSGQPFAVTQSEKQNRFVSLAQAAILSGRRFRVYATDTACPATSNCRLVTAWSLYPM